MERLVKILKKQLNQVIKEHPIEVLNDTYWKGVRIGLETAINNAKEIKK